MKPISLYPKSYSGIAGRFISHWSDRCLPMRSSAFTLVEVVTVMSIIIVAVALAVPAVTSLSKGSGRQAAVSTVIAALDQARSLAISQSINHYVVFADNNALLPEAYRCKAFAIFAEHYIPESEAYDLAPVGNWTILPTGMVFHPDKTVLSAEKKSFYCAPAGGEKIELPCFKFNEIGALELPTSPDLSRVRVFEGTFATNGAAVATNQAETTAPQIIDVSPVTGRAKLLETVSR